LAKINIFFEKAGINIIIFIIFASKLKIVEQDLVSVIMPTYNASKYLADSIDSVLNQTYKNIELLITDDCSPEADTHKILERYKNKDTRIKIFYQKENLGSGAARNISIENAKGRYIAFCDSDDKWFPEKLEKQIAFMKEKQCALCCTSYIRFRDKEHRKEICIAQEVITYNDMLCDNKIGCLTAIYDIEKLGRKYFMPTIRKRQDWAMFLTIIRSCRYAYGMKEPLAYYRIRENSVSSNKISLLKYNANVYQEILGYSKIKSYLYLFLLFLPTYALKILKRNIDSYKYKTFLRMSL